MSTNTSSPIRVMTIPVTLRNMAILPLTLAPSQSLGATCFDDMAKQTAINPKREKRHLFTADNLLMN